MLQAELFIIVLLAAIISHVFGGEVCSTWPTYRYCDDGYYCCDNNTSCCAHSLSAGGIAGAVIGCIIFFCICAVVIYACKRKHSTVIHTSTNPGVTVVNTHQYAQPQPMYGQPVHGQPMYGQQLPGQPMSNPAYPPPVY